MVLDSVSLFPPTAETLGACPGLKVDVPVLVDELVELVVVELAVVVEAGFDLGGAGN